MRSVEVVQGAERPHPVPAGSARWMVRVLWLVFGLLCVAFQVSAEEGGEPEEEETEITDFERMVVTAEYQQEGGNKGGRRGVNFPFFPAIADLPFASNLRLTPCENSDSPVVFASGNKVLDALDFATSDGAIELRRTYSKQSGLVSGFGPGWVWSFHLVLSRIENPAWTPVCQPGTGGPGEPCPLQPGKYSTIITRRPDGTSHAYTWNAASQRYEDARAHSTSWITEDLWRDSLGNEDHALGRHTLQREDGGTEIYRSATGRAWIVHDVRGEGYTLAYVDLGMYGHQVSLVQHTSGRNLTLDYTDGRISSIIAPNGEVFSYGYTNGRLTQVTYPDSLGTRTYHYEDAALPDALTGYSIDGVRWTRYAYRSDGKVDYSGREGGVERDTFDYGADYTDITNALGYTTRYSFTEVNGVRRVSGTSLPASDACAGGAAFKEYDLRGYVSREVDFEGYQTFFTWDDRGHLQEKRTGVGPAPGNSTSSQQRTTYGWDATRNLLNRSSRYGSSGSIQSETLYTYHPDSPSSHARLLQKVETCAPTCASGSKRTTTYSYVVRANRMIQSMTVDGPLAGTDDAVTYAYDTAGNLVSVTNGLGHAVTFSDHDGLGRTGRVVRENGAVEEYEYDALGRVTLARAIVDGNTRTTTHTYNGAGQPLTTTTPDGVTLTREYDAVGRLLREYHDEAGGTFAVKRYTYNDLSLVTSVKVQRTTAVVRPSGTPTLSIDPGAAGDYTVGWTTSGGTEYYQLQEKVDGGSWATSNQGLSTSKSFSGQAAGTYAYRVRACNAEGCTAYSAEESLEVVYPPGSAPTLTAPATSSTGSFSVTWTSISTATRYELQQRQGSGSWNKIHDAAGTSKAVSGLASGSYGYRVRACNAGGCGAYSAVSTTVVTHPPGSAPSLTAPATNNTGSFSVTWASVSTATRYELQQRQDGGNWSKIHDAAGTSKAVSGLASGSYDYRVRACNVGGCGSYSAVRTTAVTHPPGSAPSLTAPTTNSTGGFSVTWTSVTTATRYELQQRKDSGSWSKIHDASSRSKAVSGLDNGSYDYRVRACNAGGCGAYSAVSTTVVTHPPGSAPSLTVPATSSTGSFSVTWTSVSTATRYELQQRVGSGSWSKIHDASSRSKAVSGLASGSYGYRVRACNAGGCGAYSAVSTAVVTHPPGSAPSLTAPATSSTGGFSVTWTSVATATRYELQQRLGSGSWSKIHDAAGTSKAVSGLGNGSYGYRARACNAGGCGAYSTVRTTVVTHPPGSAPSLTAPATNSTGGFSVTWTSVSTATRYELQQRLGSGSWSKIHDAAGTSKAVSGLGSGSYGYRVRACNTGGCGAYSTVRTTVVTRPPTSAPDLFAISPIGNGHSVTWSAVTGATRYELGQSTNNGPWTLIYNGSETIRMVNGVMGPSSYRVRACNVGGCGPYVTSGIIPPPSGPCPPGSGPCHEPDVDPGEDQ